MSIAIHPDEYTAKEKAHRLGLAVLIAAVVAAPFWYVVGFVIHRMWL